MTSPSQFIRQLKEIRVSKLDKNAECEMCYKTFPNGGEIASRLPCSHIVGKDCITEWLVQGKDNSCPYCHKKLFPPPQYLHGIAIPDITTILTNPADVPIYLRAFDAFVRMNDAVGKTHFIAVILGELALYSRLRREGHALPRSPHEDKFLEVLVHIGAFHNPTGGRVDAIWDHIPNARQSWANYRDDGMVYCQGDGPGGKYRAGRWIEYWK